MVNKCFQGSRAAVQVCVMYLYILCFESLYLVFGARRVESQLNRTILYVHFVVLTSLLLLAFELFMM